MEIEAGVDEIVIRRVRRVLTLEAMFAGRTADEWRALYLDAHDWGPDVGREIVDA